MNHCYSDCHTHSVPSSSINLPRQRVLTFYEGVNIPCKVLTSMTWIGACLYNSPYLNRCIIEAAWLSVFRIVFLARPILRQLLINVLFMSAGGKLCAHKTLGAYNQNIDKLSWFMYKHKINTYIPIL